MTNEAPETREASDRRTANMRLAAGLNAVLLSMQHAGRTVVTDRDGQFLRVILGAMDAITQTGSQGVIPSGFEIVKSSQSAGLDAMHKALQEQSQEGGGEKV